MAIKPSFNNVVNVLLDWNPAVAADVDANSTTNYDHCSWRGIVCDNLTSVVVSVYAPLLGSFSLILVSSTHLV